MVVLVGGADQREVALIGNREDDAPVGVLEEIGPVVLEQPADDDVGALDQPDLGAGVAVNDVGEHVGDPRARGIDQRACGYRAARAALALERDLPELPLALGDDAAGARIDAGAARARVDRVEDDQPEIVDRAVGILEAVPVDGPERLSGGIGVEARRSASAAECCGRRGGHRRRGRGAGTSAAGGRDGAAARSASDG